MSVHEMSPVDWALRPIKKYAVFEGRAPRAEYWWFALATSIVSLVLYFLDTRIGNPIFSNYGPLRTAFLILLALPSYAVTVRRLHDIDATGWWVLGRLAGWLLVFGPMEGFDRAYFEQLSGWQIAVVVIVGLGWLCADITLLVFMFIGGTKGSNRYGPDPYGPGELEEVFA
jgi:uncharacterized membrane protein YhaH (DUF805 family)